MTTKKKIPAVKMEGESKSAKMANATIKSSFVNAALTQAFIKDMLPENDLVALAEALQANIKDVQAGDMASMEAMLVGQAQALQSIFVSLGRRAVAQTQLKHYGMYLTLALKAQSQSRATIQALTELKYPKQISFVKQANISHGNQQVNNGTNTHVRTHARENTNQPNELLEVNHGCEKMDNRATQTTIPQGKAMETVGTEHRGTNGTR